MNRRALLDQPDLLLCAAALVPAAIAASGTFGMHMLLRAVLATPLVLFLPGYVFVNALFPTLIIPTVERLVLSIGTSIGLVIMCGLALGALGALAPAPWALVLFVLTLAGIVTAWLRRLRLGQPGPRLGRVRMPRLGVVLVVIALLLTANVLVGMRLLAHQNEPLAPLQLWLVAQQQPAHSALLGARGGPEAGEYEVRLSIGSEPVQTFNIALDPNETWQTVVTFSPEQRAFDVEAELFAAGSETPLRYVVLRPEADDGG